MDATPPADLSSARLLHAQDGGRLRPLRDDLVRHVLSVWKNSSLSGPFAIFSARNTTFVCDRCSRGFARGIAFSEREAQLRALLATGELMVEG